MPKKFSVTWTAPANDGGAAITDYEIGYTPAGGSETVESHGGTTPPHEILNLTDGETYSVRVRAINSQGAGAWSSAVSQVAVVPVEWTPHLLTNRALWLDATYEPSLTKVDSAIYPVGEEIGAWEDRTANGVSVTQSNSTNKPLYEATDSSYQINGKPAVAYTDAAHALSNPLLSIGTDVADHATPIHVFAVGSLFSPATNPSFLFDGANGIAERFYGRWVVGSDSSVRVQATTRNIDEGDGTAEEKGTSQVIDPGADPWLINVENNRQGNASFIRANGADVSPANCEFGVEGFDGITIGNNIYSSQSILGLLGEFLVVTGALAQNDREKIEGYLAHKWELTASLPAAHPYKTTAPFYEN